MLTVQPAVPEQPPPDQPVKVEPASGAALRVTVVPSLKLAEQALPQSIPAGVEVTDPDPWPVRLTVSERSRVKLALTWRSRSISTVQLPVPEQPSPDQPVKVEPGAADALRVTEEPGATPVEQTDPQSSPAGAEVTEPEPLPVLVAARVFRAA